MMGNWEGHSDRRRCGRLAKTFPLTVLEAEVSAEGGRGSSGENQYVGRAIASRASGMNISKGGLAFESRKPFRAGTVLAFEVTLPEPEDYLRPMIRRFVERRLKGFRALCQVVWVGVVSAGNYQVGVRFIDVDVGRSGALEQLMEEDRWQKRLMSRIEGPEERPEDFDEGWGEL
jgi:hypothetical protein